MRCKLIAILTGRASMHSWHGILISDSVVEPEALQNHSPEQVTDDVCARNGGSEECACYICRSMYSTVVFL